MTRHKHGMSTDELVTRRKDRSKKESFNVEVSKICTVFVTGQLNGKTTFHKVIIMVVPFHELHGSIIGMIKLVELIKRKKKIEATFERHGFNWVESHCKAILETGQSAALLTLVKVAFRCDEPSRHHSHHNHRQFHFLLLVLALRFKCFQIGLPYKPKKKTSHNG